MSGLEVKGSNRSYAVYRDGARITQIYYQRTQAEQRMEVLKRTDASSFRRCMCCTKEFESEGPHNRLCNTCRGQNFDQAMLGGSAVIY